MPETQKKPQRPTEIYYTDTDPLEVEQITKEIFDDDCYHAAEVFEPGDIWADVGCHIGLFGMLANQYGSRVAWGVDTDEGRLKAYAHNVPEAGIAMGRVERVEQVMSLHEANALKLDIQGAEWNLINLDPLSQLSSKYNKLLLEWHFPQYIHRAVNSLEYHYKVQFVDEHEDILTHESTHIIYATRKTS